MLMPKRVKHRKVQRGRMKGKATRGNFLAYGDYGIQATELVVGLQVTKSNLPELLSIDTLKEVENFG